MGEDDLRGLHFHYICDPQADNSTASSMGFWGATCGLIMWVAALPLVVIAEPATDGAPPSAPGRQGDSLLTPNVAEYAKVGRQLLFAHMWLWKVILGPLECATHMQGIVLIASSASL
jgi:hypothetical protein